MNAPQWVNSTVQVFGKQLGLQNFSLNERGVAAVRFENGVRLVLEYGAQSLIISTQIKAPANANALKLLLAQSHYADRSQFRVRSYYVSRAGEAACAVAIPEGELNVTAMERVFQELWKRAEYLGRKLEWQ